MHDIVFVAAPSDAISADIARRWQFPVAGDVPDGLYLRMQDGSLGLYDGADRQQKHAVSVNFLSPQSQYRKAHGGGRGEPVVKAIGMKGSDDYRVIDATPGLGRDAFVLASAGCHVTLIERSSVVAALLEDGLRRLKDSDPLLAARLTLLHGNSAEVMQYWDQSDVDAVYLDPMFPHRKKSAMVKKEMRLFQQLLGDDPDADALLPPARQLAKNRVVVKRPNSAEPLGADKPSMAITSKKHRFDVYICHNA
ncbi:class I SAM-dependent methyltransferase [Alteromonas halophila]|uniref:Ribosomal RNA small subunit methyltransferase J n=1 Tax=Alteromonas halophila TaxID=516698 RepID=A0A918MZA8_9ALTE|nr:ribosomal RNA small subunit methyltransferase J [Alteromonas halophila]